MHTQTPQQVEKEEIIKIVQNFLGEEYIKISLDKIMIEEDMKEETTQVRCALALTNSEERILQIEATGRGVIDALFNGLRRAFVSKYYSFEDIFFDDFSINIDPFSRRKKSGTDVAVYVDLTVVNSTNVAYHFASSSRSFNTAAIYAVLEAIEYYLNCEVAVLRLKELIKDAQKRLRDDLEATYIHMLGTIVRSASYIKTVEEWKNKN